MFNEINNDFSKKNSLIVTKESSYNSDYLLMVDINEYSLTFICITCIMHNIFHKPVLTFITVVFFCGLKKYLTTPETRKFYQELPQTDVKENHEIP